MICVPLLEFNKDAKKSGSTFMSNLAKCEELLGQCQDSALKLVTCLSPMQLEPERDNNGSDEFLPFLLADKKCALPDRSGLYLLLRDDNLGFLALHEASDEIKLEDKIQLISMCMLLCSEVWYSAVGPISDDFLRQFEWLEQLPSKIKLHSVNQGPEAMEKLLPGIMPKMVILVRGFENKWLSEKGEKSENALSEYLDQALQRSAGYEEDAMKANLCKALLSTYFPNRECVALSCMQNEDLYNQQIKKIGSRISHTVPDSKIDGHYVLRGNNFVKVFTWYNEAFQGSSAFCIRKITNAYLSEQIQRSIQLATDECSFSIDVESILTLDHLFERQIQGLAKGYAVLSKLELRERDYNLLEPHLKFFCQQVKSIFHDQRQKNNARSMEFCKRTVEPLQNRDCQLDAKDKSEHDSFSNIESHIFQFKATIQKGIANFRQSATGPAVNVHLKSILMEIATQSFSWGRAMLTKYRTHMDESTNLLQDLNGQLNMLSGTENANQSEAAIEEQKSFYEDSLKDHAESLSLQRRRYREEQSAKQIEIERLNSTIESLKKSHQDAYDDVCQRIQETREKINDLEKNVVVERERRTEVVSEITRELLDSERVFHKEEKSLICERKDLTSKVIELERTLAVNKAKHLEKVFLLEQEGTKAYETTKEQLDHELATLRDKGKEDAEQLRQHHESAQGILQDEIALLDEKLLQYEKKLNAALESNSDLCRQS